MGITRLFIGVCLVPHVALALECSGSDPDWTLSLQDDAATFSFLDRTTDMSIPQRSTPEGLDWPKAMTLIGLRDSAIVILEAPDNGQDIRVLTQRGETPILLVGRCAP